MNQLDDVTQELSRFIVRAICFVFFIGFLCAAGIVFAEPTHEARGSTFKVTVYSEKCALQEVTNLPLRAVWTEGAKVIEGCFGMSPFGLIVFYFTDKTVFAMPPDMFKKVVAT